MNSDHMNFNREIRQIALGAIWGFVLFVVVMASAAGGYHAARAVGLWILQNQTDGGY